MQAPNTIVISDDILKLFDQNIVAIIATLMDLSGFIKFYYPNSNDMASMQLHCNGSIATYQTVNILSLGTRLTHLHYS